jgi:uracil-DNA glycosylase
MPDNYVDEIKNYFEWYQTVYGKNIRVEGTIDLLIGKSLQPENTTTNVRVVKDLIKNGFDEYLVHQDNPDLKAFFHQINTCTKCSLGNTRKNFVFGMGNPQADIMFIGEAPGQDEDLQGFPFVGRAGKLLDKMLFALKLKREEIYIANVLKCRPPNNRDPLPAEVELCEPYLKKQIDIIKPKIIVALGRISAQVLLKRIDSLSQLRRDDHQYENIPFIVTYHPAALLRNPRWKVNAWEDLNKIKLHLQ